MGAVLKLFSKTLYAVDTVYEFVMLPHVVSPTGCRLIMILIIIIIIIIIIIKSEKNLLTTMLTIKILFTINSLKKKKKLFIQNTIYNSCRFKKHSIELRKS